MHKNGKELGRKRGRDSARLLDGIRAEAGHSIICTFWAVYWRFKRGWKPNTLVNYSISQDIIPFPGLQESGRSGSEKSDAAVLQRPLPRIHSIWKWRQVGEHRSAIRLWTFCGWGRYLRINPADNALKKWGQTQPGQQTPCKTPLQSQQKLLGVDFLKTVKFCHWLPYHYHVVVECGLPCWWGQQVCMGGHQPWYGWNPV